jgi:transposase
MSRIPMIDVSVKTTALKLLATGKSAAAVQEELETFHGHKVSMATLAAWRKDKGLPKASAGRKAGVSHPHQYPDEVRLRAIALRSQDEVSTSEVVSILNREFSLTVTPATVAAWYRAHTGKKTPRLRAPLTQEIADQLRVFQRMQVSAHAMAKELRVSTTTIYRWLNSMSLSLNPARTDTSARDARIVELRNNGLSLGSIGKRPDVKLTREGVRQVLQRMAAETAPQPAET